jgi:glycine oxidase
MRASSFWQLMIQDDVVIVGGGVIGLSIAYVLAREGVRATLFDRRELGREASWAGAGMIPPAAERPAASAMSLLRSRSARLYPEWSAALKEETGIDNEYRCNGGVDVAWTIEDEQTLRATAGRWRTEGITYERLAADDFRRVEPALNPELRAAYFLPDRAQIRNPRHLRALAKAAEMRGVVLRPGEAVVGFVAEGGQVAAVETENDRIPCGCAVVAAGAWSESLLGSMGIAIATPPLKGQIVLLRGERPMLRRIVEHGKNYLVPRSDGRILVGATEEDAGFDTRPTSAGVHELLEEAIRLCPPLAKAEVELAWAGLRPGSVDTRPYIGPAPGYRNLFIATGHKRAGLQLSPATAEIVADLVLGRTPSLDISPFRVDREPAEADDEAFRS